jgi:hypothetical protein
MNKLKNFFYLTPRLLMLFFFTVNPGFHAHASEPLPFNTPLKKLIRAAFYEQDRPSPAKLEAYRAVIERRLHDVEQNLKRVYTLQKSYSPQKAAGKILKKSDIEAYHILLDVIGQMEQQDDPVKFQRLALKALRLDYALKITARKLSSVELIEKIPFSLKAKKIPLHQTPRGEASNLVNPETGAFYSQAELRKIKGQGGDISALNPPSDGVFWVDHDVSAVDVRRFYMSGGDPLHNGIQIVFPDKKAYYDEVRKTQSKPKLDLFFLHKGKQHEVKMKLGAEVYSETTCAALLTTLGFSADITKYVKDFKIVLGQVTYREFRLEWESYYGGYQLDKYIKSKGSDKEGNYIIFKSGVLEAKPGELIRVGPWAYGGNGNGGMREVRALLLFNMWVNNLDLKESENNKLVLRKIGEKYRYFHIQHDMGFSFGKTYMERPGAFLWKLVKKKTGKSIVMNFNCLVDNSLFDYVTYADARWMARLIARLSRRQIADAVDLGGWPESVRGLLVEKLIARRNQLVEAFGLVGEETPEGNKTALMKYDRHLTTPDGVVVDGKLKVYRFGGHPQYFGPRVNEILALILKGLRNGAVDSVVNLAASVRYIVLDPADFGLDRRIISKIVLRMDRQMERNPDPKHESETFLVMDTLQIGLRMGYGSVISGDIAYWRKYTLVYPVETRDQGRFHNKFILNLLLPFKHRGKHVPRNHAVMLEDYLEGRGKIRLYALGDMLEFALTASKVYLHRHFVRFKENPRQKQAVYFSDSSWYDELRFRVFFELFHFFRSTPLNMYVQKGKLKRDIVEMDTADLERRPDKQKALERLLLEGDPSLLQKIGKRKIIRTRFSERKSHLKLLGLIKRRSVYRVDRLQGQENGYIQVESRKLKQWRFMDNGERHFSSIRLIGATGPGKEVNDPVVTLSLRVNDRSTHDGELKRGYLSFINKMANDENFIPFDSSLHSANQIWGPTRTEVNFILYGPAIERLVQTEAANIWRALARVTGKPVSYWRREARTRYKRGRVKPGYSSKDHYLAVKTRYFIRELAKARRAQTGPDKMQRVVKALSKAVYTSGQTYDPTLLAMIHQLVDKDHLFINALVTMPENKELIFPARAPLYNQTGKYRETDFPTFKFSFDDPSEIY